MEIFSQLRTRPAQAAAGVEKVSEYNMIRALMMQYQAEVEKAKSNIIVYLNNPVGIGEHPDLAGAIDSQIEIIAHAEDKIEVLKKYYSDEAAECKI